MAPGSLPARLAGFPAPKPCPPRHTRRCSKGGNNNTYCHDGAINYVDWEEAEADRTGLARFVRALLQLRWEVGFWNGIVFLTREVGVRVVPVQCVRVFFPGARLGSSERRVGVPGP